MVAETVRTLELELGESAVSVVVAAEEEVLAVGGVCEVALPEARSVCTIDGWHLVGGRVFVLTRLGGG